MLPNERINPIETKQQIHLKLSEATFHAFEFSLGELKDIEREFIASQLKIATLQAYSVGPL